MRKYLLIGLAATALLVPLTASADIKYLTTQVLPSMITLVSGGIPMSCFTDSFGTTTNSCSGSNTTVDVALPLLSDAFVGADNSATLSYVGGRFDPNATGSLQCQFGSSNFGCRNNGCFFGPFGAPITSAQDTLVTLPKVDNGGFAGGTVYMPCRMPGGTTLESVRINYTP